MSYETKYELEIQPANGARLEDIINNLFEFSEHAEWVIDQHGNSRQDGTWYGEERDLCFFSKRYPEELFILSGVGEDEDDIWKKYIKNGKCQHSQAKIVFDSYDENKLEDNDFEPRMAYVLEIIKDNVKNSSIEIPEHIQKYLSADDDDFNFVDWIYFHTVMKKYSTKLSDVANQIGSKIRIRVKVYVDPIIVGAIPKLEKIFFFENGEYNIIENLKEEK